MFRNAIGALIGLALLAAAPCPALAQASDRTRENRRTCDTVYRAVASMPDAIAACTALIDSGDERELVEALKLRGRAYQRVMEYERALADFGRVRELAPDDLYGAWVFPAEVYLLKKDYPGGVALLTKGLEATRDPRAAGTLLSVRAELYAGMADYRRAVADYDQMLQSEPDSAHARCHRGRVLIKAGEIERGDAEIARARKLDPNEPCLANRASVAGVYKLYPRDDPNGPVQAVIEIVPLPGGVIEVRGVDQTWTGAGWMNENPGFYDWKFPDGRTGRTTVEANDDGTIRGTVSGSGIDWSFVGRR